MKQVVTCCCTALKEVVEMSDLDLDSEHKRFKNRRLQQHVDAINKNTEWEIFSG